jgi:hypothetical protein
MEADDHEARLKARKTSAVEPGAANKAVTGDGRTFFLNGEGARTNERSD